MSLFAQNVATSANLNVLTATATHEAKEGTYKVKVDKLATKTNAISNFKQTTTIVETTTATSDTRLIDLGVKTGYIAVNANGVKSHINLTQSDTIATFIEKLKGRIACVHLKDLKIVNNEQKFCEVGKGNLDWDDILAACEESGVQYALVEQDTCDRDPFDCLKTSYDFLKQKGFN